MGRLHCLGGNRTGAPLTRLRIGPLQVTIGTIGHYGGCIHRHPLLIVIMGWVYSEWDVMYGKVILTKSLIDAIYRGLLPCLRSAIEVSPSLQNQCIFALIKSAMSEQMQSTCSESLVVSPKKQKMEKDELATTETVITSSLVDKISDVERSVVEDIITNFVTRIAEWTEYEKSMHRKRLSRIDVIRKRENWAANKAIDDFDVYDDDASCWTKECDDSNEYIGWYEHDADDMKEDFDAMMLPLLSVLDGISAKVTAYEPKYQLGSASILTVDAKQAAGSTDLCPCDQDGTSAFKFAPSFFDTPPEDLRSIKFVSNLLGLDDNATVADLQGFRSFGNETSSSFVYTKEDATDRNDDVAEDGMRGKDPAWIIVGRTGRDY